MNDMKQSIIKLLILITILTISINNSAFAQNAEIIASQQDTLLIEPALPLVDSTLVEISIFDLLRETGFGKGTINISQSPAMISAFEQYKANNKERKIYGYRIRIYFDNKQNSRSNSDYIRNSFENRFPNIRAYRTSENPYFKVSVGDFRTKSDAVKAMQEIKISYQNAFITPKEVINYPNIY